MTTSSTPSPDAPPILPMVPPVIGQARNPRRRLVVALKIILFLVVLGFVVLALVRQFQQVSWDEFHFRAGPAVMALLCLVGVSAVQLLMFRTLLGAYGYRLPWSVTLGLAWVPPLGKYVPGKVAAIAGAVHLQRQHGIPGAVAVSVAMMLDGLAVIAGLITSSPLLVLHERLRERFPHAWIGCAVLAVMGLVMLHPRVFSGLLNLLLFRLRRQPLKVIPSLHRFIVPVIAAFLQWVFAGLALWYMTSAAFSVEGAMLPLFIATAALAMTFSYLALFAPGGLGVREMIYLVALGPVIGHTAAVVVVAMRVAQTLLELILAGIGLAALHRSGATSNLVPDAPLLSSTSHPKDAPGGGA